MPEQPSRIAVFARATRVKTLPLALSPVLVGSSVAWRQGAPIAIGRFVLCVAGVAGVYLASNVLNDVYDERSGADKMSRIDRAGITTASGVLEAGAIGVRGMLVLAGTLYGVALACGFALAAMGTPVVLAFGAAGALLGWQYVAPPLRYGYRGRGLGQLGVIAAFGILPVAGAFAVQARALRSDAWWAGVVPGLLTAVALFHSDFLHWRADKAAHKMTPVAVLEPTIAIAISGALLILAYVTLTLQVAVHLFPAWSMLAFVVVLPVSSSWVRTARDPLLPQNALNLLGSTLAASVLTGIVLSASLIAAR